MFGLISETCLGVFLAYCPGLEGALRMYGLRYVTIILCILSSEIFISICQKTHDVCRALLVHLCAKVHFEVVTEYFTRK